MKTVGGVLFVAALDSIADPSVAADVRPNIDVAAYCASRPSLSASVCLADATNDAFVSCAILVKLALEGRRLDADLRSRRGLPPQDPEPLEALACISSGLATSEAVYKKAVSGKHPGMVKDYYAAWRAAMDGINPSPGETVVGYTTRQAKTRTDIKRMAERLRLEE